MSSTPVWLLDVDGVINANRPSWHAAPHTAMIEAHGTMWKFRWAPAVTGFIRETALAKTAEIRWSTTWLPWARDVEAAFKLPELGEGFLPELVFGSAREAKLAAALAVIEIEKRPLIWTDDDAIPESGTYRDVLDNAINEYGTPVLLLAPKPNRGLQPEHLDQIREFLTANR